MTVSIYLFFVLFTAVLIKIYTDTLKYLGKCTSKNKLHGKTALITGGNAGIGLYTAKDFAKRGARVIIASRNMKQCEKAKNDIIEETGNKNIVVKYLDLTSFDVIREFAKDILETEERLDILVNNAGSLGFGNTYSKDGLLLGLQVNYFGPFLLTHLLIGLLKKSKRSRIINVVSVLSQFSYYKGLQHINCCPGPIFSNTLVYSNSKLFMVYMTWEFATRLKDSDVTVNCVHPGFVDTAILRKTKLAQYFTFLLSSIYYKTPEQGAQTQIYLAISDDVDDITGRYFVHCKTHKLYIKKDSRVIKEVWDKSIELVKLTPEEILV